MAFQFDSSGRLKAPTDEQLAQADDGHAVIVLDRGRTSDGLPYWAYIAVKPSRYHEFMRLTAAHQPIKLAEFGILLAYGPEADVPPEIKEGIKQRFGFDDGYIARLTETVLQEQKTFLQQKEDKRIGDIVAMLQKKKKPAGNVT